MYVCLDKTSPSLCHFGSGPYHLRVALGADGAPFGKDDEAISRLVSFLNVVQQIASETDNFILAGANCSESHLSMQRYARKLVSDVATEVEAKRKELGQTRLAESTKRTKLLDDIRSLNSQQETTPLLGPLVDKIFAEPLHNSNNACQQLHELMLFHANDKRKRAPNCTNPIRDAPGCALASHLSTLKEIRASRLYKKVKKWCSQGRKGSLSYRFTGKETKKQYDPASFHYHRSTDVYVPKKIEQPNVCYCGLDKECSAEKCSLCSSEIYKSVERSAETGALDPYICNLLSVTS
ncbi:hypothetical protein P5673_007786 [Acropora cervicornis]|uniref:Uncharacterized protein n=1 Tax=Acropora cervicornis TaxID=6130 RepID=A0AAD9QV09_ACRCE|nr:hypothetical protein P5673_007786 [Acropora cervicornis]